MTLTPNCAAGSSGIAVFVASLLFAMPASAQEVQVATTPVPLSETACGVAESKLPRHYKPAAGPVHWYNAVCGSRRVYIGPATGYRSSYNPTLRSLVVVLTRPGNTRVLLVSPGQDGSLRAINISRSLAKAAGKSTDGILRTLDVDLSQFPRLGLVSIPVAARAGEVGASEQSQPLGTGTKASLDLNSLLARGAVSQRSTSKDP